MHYVVRVTGPGKTHYEEFETHDSEKYDENEAEARSAYSAAVRNYSLENTVTLFRDGVSLTNAIGTGDSSLEDNDPEADPLVVQDVSENDVGSLVAKRSEATSSDADGEPNVGPVPETDDRLTYADNRPTYLGQNESQSENDGLVPAHPEQEDK